MNLAKYSLNILYACLFSIGLLSCSSSKNMAIESQVADKEAIAKLKSGLKFKTHFGLEGETDIKATNISNGSIDLSELMVHLEQVGTEKYKAYTLQDLAAPNNIDANEAMDLHLEMDEKIKSEFGGRIGSYNVSIVYKSKVPLNNGDERNIYYISYKYTGK